MKNQPTTLLALASLVVCAGSAHAQYRGDPGLDPRVAQLLDIPVRMPWQCGSPSAAIYGDRAAPTLWPGGVVPFEIEGTVANPTLSLNAMDVWMFRTGASPNVTFVRRDPADPAHNNYILIRGVAGSVSSSYVGQCAGCGGAPGSGQIVQQGEQVNTYVMAHEYGHALGFWHEHTRPDRDSYVDVWFSRVAPEHEHNFNIVSGTDWPAGSLNSGYDFDSVMHYSACTFSTCGGGCACISVLTCTPLDVWAGYDQWQCSMGQQDHLSTNDVYDMINVYGQRSRPLYYVGPSAFPFGTLTFPYASMIQIPGAGDVRIQGNLRTTVPAGTRFTSPATWSKHGSGPVVITGQ